MRLSVVLTTTLVLFLAAFAVAGDTPEQAHVQQQAEQSPNHLEPLYPDWFEYRALNYKKLLPEAMALMWMIVTPSFSEEYAVSLSERMDADGVFFELEYRIAKEKIWDYKKLDDGQMELDLKHDVEVEIKRARIPFETAGVLLEAWTAALKKTRYSDERVAGLDGVTYEFTAGFYQGETWSPKSGVPTMMVSTGEMLIDYINADEDKKDKILSDLAGLCRKIQQAVD